MPEQPENVILVVDNENTVLSLTQSMLARHGYTTLSAQSGEEALHLFELWPDLDVSLALIDVVMPGMSGIELAQRLEKVRPELPILFMSSHSEREVLRPVETRGLPYIAKPFSSAKLVERIRQMVKTPDAVARLQ